MKKLFVIIISAVLLLSCVPPVSAAASWPAWAEDAFLWGQEMSISGDIMAEYGAAVTRGAAVQILYDASGRPETDGDCPFSDVSRTYSQAITWAAEQGYVQGIGGGLYSPDTTVSRQEFAAIIYRRSGEPPVDGNGLSGYADCGEIASWARPAMLWCVENGIIVGRNADLLAPTSAISVAEAVVILQRAWNISDAPASPQSMDELNELISKAIADVESPVMFDISRLEAQENWDMTVKNLYYNIISQHPEYKYAYEITADAAGDRLSCSISYMPYRSGLYPEGFEGTPVSGLRELIEAASDNLDMESVPIRILDPELTVDDMNKALQQAGGSYLLCQLNRDGTAISITPLNGLTRLQALDMLEEIGSMAADICARTITDGMDGEARATALYTYLTDTVRYDFRYYSQPGEMPYESTTAYGALHDGLAICGGYAQALQSLFQQAGIPCLTVSGVMGSENHMWNLAYIEGEWLYFAATSDRGRSGYGFNDAGVGADSLTRYVWDQDFAEALAGSILS